MNVYVVNCYYVDNRAEHFIENNTTCFSTFEKANDFFHKAKMVQLNNMEKLLKEDKNLKCKIISDTQEWFEIVSCDCNLFITISFEKIEVDDPFVDTLFDDEPDYE